MLFLVVWSKKSSFSLIGSHDLQFLIIVVLCYRPAFIEHRSSGSVALDDKFSGSNLSSASEESPIYSGRTNETLNQNIWRFQKSTCLTGDSADSVDLRHRRRSIKKTAWKARRTKRSVERTKNGPEFETNSKAPFKYCCSEFCFASGDSNLRPSFSASSLLKLPGCPQFVAIKQLLTVAY